MAKNYSKYTDDELRALANQNSADWHTADDAGKQALHGENVDIYGELDRRNGTTTDYDFRSGSWQPHAPSTPSAPAATQQTSYGAMPTFDVNNAGQYISKYQGLLDNLQYRIMNRQPFQYNYENDPVWQAYKTQYNREGDRAMRNTLGEVSARTGGLASSYATTAAQQANDYYNQQLTDKIPELYRLAYSMYNDEGDNLMRQYNMIQGADDTDYTRWNADQNRAYQYYRDAVGDWRYGDETAYNRGRDTIADERYNQKWEYDTGRDALSDQQKAQADARDRVLDYLKIGGTVSGIPAELMEASGLSPVELAAYESYYQQQLLGGGGSGGGGGSRRRGGGGGGSSSSGMSEGLEETLLGMATEEEVNWYLNQHKKELGLTVDGVKAALDWWRAQQGGGGDGSGGNIFELTRNRGILNEPRTVEVTNTGKWGNGSGYDTALSKAKNMIAGGASQEAVVNYLNGLSEKQVTDTGLRRILAAIGMA